MTISVGDEAGRLVLPARGDGTGFFSPETSRAKAMAAASFKKRTAELAELVAKGGFWSIVPTILQGQILPTLGGSPIMRGGRCIGAIGCGGGDREPGHGGSSAGSPGRRRERGDVRAGR